ncbi:nucleotide-binding protein [Acinetobacter bereziniae]|uniref:nucleotide-binding protein n=1 Tax=Acinetobacter bereziniae TaxID=106648 RepID=UPI0032131E9B
MENEKLIKELEKLELRLRTDVITTLHSDYEMGVERWDSWIMIAKRIFSNYLPFYSDKLQAKIAPIGGTIYLDDSLTERLFSREINPTRAFLLSIIQNIKNGDLDILMKDIELTPQNSKKKELLKKAFIVHGHDNATKERTARYLEKLGIEAIILHEQASGGKTIIEKLEHFTDVGFGIVLYTPDDEGSVKDKKDYQPRARQNVVFEHGLLIGKLGRDRVFPLVTDHSVELPSDINGMVYLSDNSWELQLAKEIRGIGYEIDMNKVI